MSCSSIKKDNISSQVSEDVNGVLLVTNKACFFIPNEKCEYLECDDTNGFDTKALVIDYFTEKDDIQSLDPIIANISMLPNKDSSDVIVWLERSNYNLIKENECYIIPAKVRLVTHFKPIKHLSFTYILRFNWQGIVYKYKCIYNGNAVYCNIISINKHQRNMIVNSQSLPTGAEGIKNNNGG